MEERGEVDEKFGELGFWKLLEGDTYDCLESCGNNIR